MDGVQRDRAAQKVGGQQLLHAFTPVPRLLPTPAGGVSAFARGRSKVPSDSQIDYDP